MRPSLLHEVEDGVSVLDASVGADTMAVLGAKMSRAPDLVPKALDVLAAFRREGASAQHPPDEVRRFLRTNLAEYNHASIGSMAKAVWVYLYGWGWPAAWLLEDFPLFDGQEVSTRAVDSAAIPGRDGPGTPCLGAPPALDDLHDRWMSLYRTARDEAGDGGYAYDDARMLLPGTVPSGVVLTNDVRAVARHLDRIRALGGPFQELARRGYAGLRAAAPETTDAVGPKERRTPGRWRGVDRVTAPAAPMMASPEEGVSVTPVDRLDVDRLAALADALPARDRWRQYLDPGWTRGPRFRFRAFCTLACARDFHRHRPMMPWRLGVVDADGLVLAPWSRAAQRPPEQLVADTHRAFGRLLGDKGGTAAARWEALHALPFGALVSIDAVGTLPALVYMLELRASAPGAHPEYRAQARRGLEQLCEALPAWLVERESLDGALRERAG